MKCLCPEGILLRVHVLLNSDSFKSVYISYGNSACILLLPKGMYVAIGEFESRKLLYYHKPSKTIWTQ